MSGHDRSVPFQVNHAALSSAIETLDDSQVLWRQLEIEHIDVGRYSLLGHTLGNGDHTALHFEYSTTKGVPAV